MAKKQFKAESKRLLDLMINSIYTHKEIFLREIISNASDAIDKLAYLSLTDDTVKARRGDLRITVTPDKEARTLTVSDNGVGMSAQELEQNLGTIAKSGSLQFKEGMEKEGAADIIGQFGVGFYSAFMVADEVTVITRRHGEDTAHCWKSSGADGYTIAECEKGEPGTDVIMHIKANAEGMYRHFADVADAVDVPVILYNVPGRTGCSIPVETVARLAKHPNICGIKEASGNISQVAKLQSLADGKVDVYSGNDDQTVPILSLGGKGVISVLSNIAPRQVHDMCAAYFAGKTEESLRLQLKAVPLIEALFCEVNPIPIKEACNILGFKAGIPRPPLTELEDEHKKMLCSEIKKVIK